MVQPDKLAVSLEKLFSEQGERLFVYALSVTGSPERAEDAVQEAWVAALRCPPRSVESARPWLMRVVRNSEEGVTAPVVGRDHHPS